MGRSLARLIEDAPDLTLIGGIARRAAHHAAASSASLPVHDAGGAGPLLEQCDVLIDFSAPAFLGGLLAQHGDRLAGRAVVVGTTGLDTQVESLLDEIAGRAAILAAANFSRGVSLLLALVERAARALPAADYDVEIVETHHRGKADAPSGTALSLGAAVARGHAADLAEQRRDGRSGRSGERPRGEIGFHALRGGGVIGEHHVLFLGARERIELSHAATDRALFAEGALAAARWLVTRKPGRYTMIDFLGL
jgi:4-hydroxy-tetrahydrodipicolinate reductase